MRPLLKAFQFMKKMGGTGLRAGEDEYSIGTEAGATALCSGALKTLILCALALTIQPANAAPSDTQKVAGELAALLPKISVQSDESTTDNLLQLAATSLARAGNLGGALKAARTVHRNDWRSYALGEVWRITARRLAWQGNLAAATRCANRIGAEYSRADAWLAIAHAEVRAGNINAARALLHRVEPVIRNSHEPRALAYLAWQFARVGQNQTARSLFQLAKTVKDPAEAGIDLKKYPRLDHRQRIIAFYQAKSGWGEDALKTAKSDAFALSPVKAVLIARRDWQPLLDHAAQMPALQSTKFLLELCAAQLQTGNRAAARSILTTAKARYDELAEMEKQPESYPSLQLFFALAEIACGDEVAGHARFAALKAAPNFSPVLEFAFYYLLAARPSFMRTGDLEQQRVYEAKALAELPKLKDRSNIVSNYLDIARVQQKRGDKAALRQTLQLTREEIRACLMTRGQQSGRKLRRYNAAARLLEIAKIEREAGDEFSARSTRAQAMTLLKDHADAEVASLLLQYGFVREAGDILAKIAPQPASTSLDIVYEGALQVISPRYARKAGADAALSWVLKIPDVPRRALTLSGILIALTPTSPEERELILRGDFKSGARVNSRIQMPGYSNSYNFDDVMD
jgi:hypothetical protein